MLEETAFPYRIGPKYIPDFCKTPEDMFSWLAQHLSTSKVVLTKGKIQLLLHRKSATTNVFFVTLGDQRIDYVMELHKMRASLTPVTPLPAGLTQRLCYQASVWRSPRLAVADSTFVKTVFWKYLVSDSRTVVSDSAQSDAGENFWINRIAEALNTSTTFRVYGLMCEKKANSLVIEDSLLITKIDQMNQFYTEGENYNGQFMRLAIVKV